MRNTRFNEKIGDLVGKDNLEEAIYLLRKLLQDCPSLDDVILQSSRLTDVMRQIRNGTISFEDANITKNKIRIAILELSEEINDAVSKDSNLKREQEAYISNNVNWNITQNHSGTGDNIGRDKNIKVSIKATIGIIATGLLAMLFWFWFNSGSPQLLHEGEVNPNLQENHDAASLTVDNSNFDPQSTESELGITMPNSHPIPLNESDLPTYNFTIKNYNHRTLHFGLVEVEVIDYQRPNYVAHEIPGQLRPIETLVNLKPQIGYKFKSWLAKVNGADFQIKSNEAFSTHLKFYQGKAQGGYYSCKGAYALKVTFFDSEEKFSIETNELIYMIHNEFVSKAEFHKTKKLWQKYLNE